MNHVTFTASFCSMSHEDGVYIFGVSDSQRDYQHYTILQVPDVPSDRDMERETEGEHFECSFFPGGIYGIVETIVLAGDSLEFHLKRRIYCQGITCIRVVLKLETPPQQELADFLRVMFASLPDVRLEIR